MDLFYGTTPEEQLKCLKKDIKLWAKKNYNYDYGNKKLFIAYGAKENIGNNLLIISPPLLPNFKSFDDPTHHYLKSILGRHSIEKFFITPDFIVPKDLVTRTDIKNYSKFVSIFIDIIQPKFIVTLGEDSTFAFFKRKFILRDQHGKVIGQTVQGIDIILTYEPRYYMEKSEYEDPSFKNFILDNDWTIVSNMYKERIK